MVTHHSEVILTLPAGGRHHSQPRGDIFTPGRGVAAPAKVAPASAATPRPGVTPHPGVVSTPARCAETNFPAGINLGQWRPPSQRPQCTLLAETLVTIPVVTAMDRARDRMTYTTQKRTN